LRPEGERWALSALQPVRRVTAARRPQFIVSVAAAGLSLRVAIPALHLVRNLTSMRLLPIATFF